MLSLKNRTVFWPDIGHSATSPNHECLKHNKSILTLELPVARLTCNRQAELAAADIELLHIGLSDDPVGDVLNLEPRNRLPFTVIKSISHHYLFIQPVLWPSTSINVLNVSVNLDRK